MSSLAKDSTTALDSDDDESFSYRYRMDHPRRGRFIIINNETFKNGLPPRKGTDVDAERLKALFVHLEFEVVVHKDLTKGEMLRVIIQEKGRDHAQCDCFGLAVLTHGEEGKLCGVDEMIEISSLLEPLKRCESLYGKPKLFFFQAGCGNELDAGATIQADGEDPEGPETKHRANENIRIPIEADCLYASSTVPGYFAFSDDVTGSCFVQALVKQLKGFAYKNVDLARILTRVCHQVAHDFEAHCPRNPEYDGKKQMPSVVSTLTKELYFTKKSF